MEYFAVAKQAGRQLTPSVYVLSMVYNLYSISGLTVWSRLVISNEGEETTEREREMRTWLDILIRHLGNT